jgi:hypothetical protein
MQDVADGAELPLCVLESSNWIFLAVGLPNLMDLFSIIVVTSLRLFDDHRKIGAGGVTLFACARRFTLVACRR